MQKQTGALCKKQAIRGLHGLVKRDRMRKLDCRARDGVKAGGNLQNATVVGQADWNGEKPFGELKSGNEGQDKMEGKAVYDSYTTDDANLR